VWTAVKINKSIPSGAASQSMKKWFDPSRNDEFFFTSFPHEEMVFALRIAVIPCLLSCGPPWLKPLEERLAAKQRMEQDQRSHLGRAVPKRKNRLDMARNLGIS
jgi:hypothetical protein